MCEADAAPGDLAGHHRRPADEAICTGFGSERVYQSPAPASVTTNTAMRPASSPRDNESRRSLMAMGRR